jgi:hypothetical protein
VAIFTAGAPLCCPPVQTARIGEGRTKTELFLWSHAISPEKHKLSLVFPAKNSSETIEKDGMLTSEGEIPGIPDPRLRRSAQWRTRTSQ